MKNSKLNIKDLCEKSKDASRAMALINTRTKDMAIKAMGRALLSRASYILKENAKDVRLAKDRGLTSALIDRLTLIRSRIMSMAQSLLEIAGMKDPVGESIETRRRPNGLIIKKVRVPIGNILVIYESRPDVTSDCIGLCLKSGNSVILRGGSESIRSNSAIFDVLNASAMRHGIPSGALTLIKDTSHKVVDALLGESAFIDLVVPRGGGGLIREVTAKARMPVIKHYKGVCHTYVDASADLKMASDICYNAKVQRPGVCNAMECMLVNRAIAGKFLPEMIARLQAAGVEIIGSAEVRRLAGKVRLAAEKDWYTEYLDLKLSVNIVSDVDEAIAHIMKYGSYHSDAIVTKDRLAADKFLKGVDSACVYVNASTRFTDGGEFGKGAEMGISTDKIHARGPMGVEELTSYKYVIYGNGQVRK